MFIAIDDVIKEIFRMNFTPLVILLFLVVFLAFNALNDKRLIKHFYITIIHVFVLLIVDSIEYYCQTLPNPTTLRIVMSIMGYTLRPTIIINVISLVHRFKPKRLLLHYIPCLIVFIISSTAFFTDIAFSYDEANNFIRGPLGLIPHVVSIGYLLLTFYYSLIMYKEKSIQENLIVIACILVILISLCIEMSFNIKGLLNSSTVISIAFYYFHINVQASKRDVLTGALNRHSFYLDSKRYEKTFQTIISLDLNNLKSINDNQGHLLGDEYIINVSKIVINNLKHGFKFYRVGGDEFIIIVTKDISKDEIEAVINNINSLLEANNYSTAIGIAYKESDNSSFNEVLQKADLLMYKDKERKKASITT